MVFNCQVLRSGSLFGFNCAAAEPANKTNAAKRPDDFRMSVVFNEIANIRMRLGYLFQYHELFVLLGGLSCFVSNFKAIDVNALAYTVAVVIGSIPRYGL